MAFQMNLAILSAVVESLLSVALAALGTATFYTSYVPSACFGNSKRSYLWYGVECYNLPAEERLMHPCTGQSVVVKIVDHCPGCDGTLHLSKEAFATIANPVAGIINIHYHH